MADKVRLSLASRACDPFRLEVRAGAWVSFPRPPAKTQALAFSGLYPPPMHPSVVVPGALPTCKALFPSPPRPTPASAAAAPRTCNPTSVFPLQFGNEEQQLAWAKRESEKAEQERLARLRRQEQEDLELAIALSKADMPAA